MRTIWAARTIDVPASVVWHLVTDVDHWPTWGPSVRDAVIDGGTMRSGATGSVTTVGGVALPFVITTFVDGASWSWDVAGIGATEHRVDGLDAGRCRVHFGVPWVAAPYLVVCHAALPRLESLALAQVTGAAEPPGTVRTP